MNITTHHFNYTSLRSHTYQLIDSMFHNVGLINRFAPLLRNATAPSSNNTITLIQKRFINKCLHIKGLPTHLTKEDLYDFMKSYGSIDQLAAYPEQSKNYEEKSMDSDDIFNAKRRNFITHNRPPGQTAIVHFEDLSSAAMCKEELHWRPYPDEKFELNEDIINTNPRDRPLVNILFQTNILDKQLRPWVRRDLDQSRYWIADKEGTAVKRRPNIRNGNRQSPPRSRSNTRASSRPASPRKPLSQPPKEKEINKW